jgi:hypothetical protein
MVINQFHSIGDLIFIEPICRMLWEKNGEKPILPVRDHLMWMFEYIDAARFTPMSKFKLDYDSMATNNPDYLPLRFANQIIRNLGPDDHSDLENMMLDKYKLSGMNPELWKTISLKFNEIRGRELFAKLDLDPAEKYILVNENSQAGKINIVPGGHRIIYMNNIPGFTVLDWYLVMLHARENHHVSTCTFFLLQALHNKFKFKSKVFIYPRPNYDGLRGISQLKPDFNLTLVEI